MNDLTDDIDKEEVLDEKDKYEKHLYESFISRKSVLTFYEGSDRGKSDYECIFKQLSKDREISNLEMKMTHIYQETMGLFSSYILIPNKTPWLKVVDLSYSTFYDDSFSLFCDIMKNNITVKSLSLSYCLFEKKDTVIDDLYNMLSTNENLRAISLRRVFTNETNRRILNKVCDMISISKVRFIDITFNFYNNVLCSPLSIEYHLKLLESLRFNTSIESFLIPYYLYHPGYLKKIIDILENHNSTLIDLFRDIDHRSLNVNRSKEYDVIRRQRTTIDKLLKRNHINRKKHHTFFDLMFKNLDYYDTLNDDFYEKIKRIRIN